MFLERVREDYPDLPFVLYTGKGSEEIASEAISAGVTDYLEKEGGTAQYTLLYNRILNAVERYRTERAFTYGRKRYRSLVEESPNAICLVQDGRIVYANGASRRLVDAPEARELYGTEYVEFVHSDYREQATERLKRIEEQGVPVEREIGKITTVEGAVRDVEVTATPISYCSRSCWRSHARAGPSTSSSPSTSTSSRRSAGSSSKPRGRLSAPRAT